MAYLFIPRCFNVLWKFVASVLSVVVWKRAERKVLQSFTDDLISTGCIGYVFKLNLCSSSPSFFSKVDAFLSIPSWSGLGLNPTGTCAIRVFVWNGRYKCNVLERFGFRH